MAGKGRTSLTFIRRVAPIVAMHFSPAQWWVEDADKPKVNVLRLNDVSIVLVQGIERKWL